MLPKTFSESRILLHYKKLTPEVNDQELFNKVTDCFKKYCLKEYGKPQTKPEVSEVCTDTFEFRTIVHKLFLLGNCFKLLSSLLSS